MHFQRPVRTHLDDHAHARVDACYEGAEGGHRVLLHGRTVEANLQQRLVLIDVEHLQRTHGIDRDMTDRGPPQRRNVSPAVVPGSSRYQISILMGYS